LQLLVAFQSSQQGGQKGLPALGTQVPLR